MLPKLPCGVTSKCREFHHWHCGRIGSDAILNGQVPLSPSGVNDDLDSLQIERPEVLARATEHIPQMVELVERLSAAGAASGDYAVVLVESFRVNPATCFPVPTDDQFHMWLVGGYVP